MHASPLRSDRKVPVNYGRRERMLHPVEAVWRDVENEPSPMTWDWAIDWVTIRTQEDDA